MKKIFLPLLLMVAVGSTKAQNAQAVFSTHEIVWYGMDFTKAKFVGEFDQGAGAMPAKGYDMKNKWIPQWNALIVREQPHFDLKKAFDVDNVIYDVEPLNTINSKIDGDAAMVPNPGKIEKSEINDMVAKYPVGDKKSGIGSCFIVENFNKNTETATVYVTFFDIATHKVLLCEKEEGKCLGIGMRNYWAGAVKAIIKNIEKDWHSWKKS